MRELQNYNVPSSGFFAWTKIRFHWICWRWFFFTVNTMGKSLFNIQPPFWGELFFLRPFSSTFTAAKSTFQIRFYRRTHRFGSWLRYAAASPFRGQGGRHPRLCCGSKGWRAARNREAHWWRGWEIFCSARWWQQLKYFWNFHLRSLGKMNPIWRAYFYQVIQAVTKLDPLFGGHLTVTSPSQIKVTFSQILLGPCLSIFFLPNVWEVGYHLIKVDPNFMEVDTLYLTNLILRKHLKTYLEPQTTIYKWLFQLDDSKSLHRKWLFHQRSIYKWLFGVPGSNSRSFRSKELVQ